MRVEEAQSMHSMTSSTISVDSDLTSVDLLTSADLFDFNPEMASDKKIAEEKEKYRGRVISYCTDTARPLNVAVIGPPGVGKSSLVNTIAAAFSDDTWREHAYSGYHGDASQITVFTTSFPKCCHEKDERYLNINLPTLIDIAGFTDEERERYVELLRIVFYGRLPEGESLAEADEYYKKYGLDGLRRKYAQNDEALKVDRVVVVSAATSEVPENLIRCVVQAARPPGLKDSRKRAIPLFGVMTKQDKIGSEELSKEDYQKREDLFINAVGLKGSMHRFMRCRNYCDDVDHGRRIDTVIPELDLPALRFMSQLADPEIKVLNEMESYTDKIEDEEVTEIPSETTVRRRQTAQAEADTTTARQTPPRRTSNRIPTQRNSEQYIDMKFAMVVFVEALLMAIMLQFFLSPPVDVGKLRGVCRYMKSQHYSIYHGSMEEVCENIGGSMGPVASTIILLIIMVVIRLLSRHVAGLLQKS